MGRRREFDTDKALEAAMEVFWQKGYEGASFEDLSQATGVARPGLYAAFGNKESLFLKAFDLYETKFLPHMRDAFTAPTAYDVVERILRGTVDILTRYPSHPGCLGTNGALACSDDAEPIRLELAHRRIKAQQALQVRLTEAKSQGDLPETANCAVLAQYIMTITQGMAVQAKAGATNPELTAVADHVLASWPR